MKRTWTVKISVDDVWIADGFDLDEERLQDMVLNDLQFAGSSEVTCKIIKAPNPDTIKYIQGYPINPD